MGLRKDRICPDCGTTIRTTRTGMDDHSECTAPDLARRLADRERELKAALDLLEQFYDTDLDVRKFFESRAARMGGG